MLNTDNKNFKILALAISALIVGVEAQTVNCTTASPQCCWVVRSWQLMGKAIPTGIISTDNSCCSMDGVTCGSQLPCFSFTGCAKSTTTNITMISWFNKALKGSIPSEMGKLTSLTWLKLEANQLSGSIPAAIGNLTKLQTLNLTSNQLSGSIPAEIGKLIKLEKLWLSYNKLSGSIPVAIGNLTSLTSMNLQSNQLSGSIPAAIGNLANLTGLYLNDNPLLNGIFIPYCRQQVVPTAFGGFLTIYSCTLVFATNTSVTLCGGATSGSPANRFPPAGTSFACLATGPATPMAKRALVFSQNIGAFKYTCNNDTFGNPYQDCLNAQGVICNPTYIAGNQDLIKNCKDGIDKMTRGLSYHWQNVRRACGQWSFDGISGSYNSSNCINANNALQQNAFYISEDGIKSPVTAELTKSVISGLWSKIIS